MARERKKEEAYELLIRKRTNRACQKLAAFESAQTQVLQTSLMVQHLGSIIVKLMYL
jgi:hypothetical protein